jgi:L-amino acid N-acyltransferase
MIAVVATAPSVAVRLASVDDAEAIRRIYNVEVESGTATFDLVPRSLDDQRAILAARTGAHPILVAEQDGEIVGFGSLSAYRDRPAYTTTVENSVYVDHAHQGRGAGRALLEELLRVATNHGFHCVIARISGGNEGSVRLHERCGFELVGVEREVGRKFGRWLDVVVMQRLL